MSVGVGGAGVTSGAQRHEIRRQQIYAWRHKLKKKGFDEAPIDEGLDEPSPEVADAAVLRRRPRVLDGTSRERRVFDLGTCCPDCGGDLRVATQARLGDGRAQARLRDGRARMSANAST